MKSVNPVKFGEHSIAESKFAKIENDVVRKTKKAYKEYGFKRFEINLIRHAASQAIQSIIELANDLENKRSK